MNAVQVAKTRSHFVQIFAAQMQPEEMWLHMHSCCYAHTKTVNLLHCMLNTDGQKIPAEPAEPKKSAEP